MVAEFGYELDTNGVPRQPLVVGCDSTTVVGEPGDDFAVITTSTALPDDVPVLPLCVDARPEVGDRVAIMQHPEGLPKKIAPHHNLVRYSNDEVVQYWTDSRAGFAPPLRLPRQRAELDSTARRETTP